MTAIETRHDIPPDEAREILAVEPPDIEEGPPRDGYKRPLIVPPEGGKPVGYTRATTFIDCLDDTTNLTRWKLRMTARGLSRRGDLNLRAYSLADATRELDQVVEEALEAGGANEKRNLGSALHKICQDVDEGKAPVDCPIEYAPDVAAYQQATEMLEPVQVEDFMVCDEYQIGGTPDRIVRVDGLDGLYVADLKTGGVEYGALKIAMQLSIYAHSQLYDWRTDPPTRTPIPGLNTDRALVIHLPAGEGVCSVYWIDIAAGWAELPTAAAVRTARKRRNLLTPYADGIAEAPKPALRAVPTQTLGPAHPSYVPPTPTPGETPAPRPTAAQLGALIADATTAKELLGLWETYGATVWNPNHTAAAAARKTQIERGIDR